MSEQQAKYCLSKMDFAKMGAISATLIRARFAVSVVGIPRDLLVRLRPEYRQKIYPDKVSAIECNPKKWMAPVHVSVCMYERAFSFAFKVCYCGI